ncbi:tumor necrosis factor receptor superfamily member 10B-like [Phaethornis superciliosus]
MRGGLRCALRCSGFSLLLLLFLSPREIVLGTAAAAWSRRDRLDPLDPSRDEYYQVQESGIYCRKCPAGTYVAEHCNEQKGSSKCLPCTGDGYIAYPNGFTKCLGCQTCREDQVELRSCQATSDTQCACRNGTFCSPDHPCEMCQKCRPKCGEGEVELAPCTPHSDRRCGPATPSSSSLGDYGIVAIVLALGVLLAVSCCCCWCCCYSPVLRRSLDIFAQDVPCKDWRRFGRALDLSENDIDLAFVHNESSLEPFFQMLNTWLSRQGMKASVDILLDTLHKINLGGIAETITSKLIQQGDFQYEVS